MTVHYIECHGCGVTLPECSAVFKDSYYWCESCCPEGEECSICGEYFPVDDLNITEMGLLYCNDCVKRLDE